MPTLKYLLFMPAHQNESTFCINISPAFVIGGRSSLHFKNILFICFIRKWIHWMYSFTIYLCRVITAKVCKLSGEVWKDFQTEFLGRLWPRVWKNFNFEIIFRLSTKVQSVISKTEILIGLSKRNSIIYNNILIYLKLTFLYQPIIYMM